MTPPTWDQLIADNRATAGRSIRAQVHHSYNVGNGWSTQHVWFMPPERWRIDDEAGEPRIVRSDHWMFRRIDESGVMERYDAIPQANPVTTEEPHELLVAYRLWPAPPAPPDHPTRR